ncbi:hypothetical protein, partial [Crocosphaera sp.]|uniref:beta strand repeat-containing protein n=1 Tax=Crocosphaera sp. TaxID=2729996 RepID=UPI00261C8214
KDINTQSLNSGFSESFGKGGDITLNAQGNITTQSIDSRSLNSGNITIKTVSLFLNDAVIIADTSGQGDAGLIDITAADTISLSNASVIRSQVTSQNQGNSGGIKINTGSLSLATGSQISGSTSGEGNAGKIEINARETISLSGENRFGFESGIFSQVNEEATGNSGGIKITTGSLFISDRAVISANSLGEGNSGLIDITATDTISISGKNSNGLRPGIVSEVRRPDVIGNAGGIKIKTGSLSLTDGGQIAASTFGEGNAGIIEITNSNTIFISGQSPNEELSGIFSQVNNEAIGNSGGINIKTGSLSLTDGGQIGASTFGEGDAGIVDITNRNTISISGQSPNEEPSGIFSQVNNEAIGNSGGIKINTNHLSLINESQISARTNGQGIAGDINITANTVEVNQGGQLLTDTISEFNAGDINIKATEFIKLTGQGSQAFENALRDTFQARFLGTENINLPELFSLSTITNSTGVAGNITIDTPQLTLDNGAVLASTSFTDQNAGNISINSSNLDINGSGLVSAAVGSQGQAGEIIINTATAKLTDGGKIITTTFSADSGGNVIINANEAVELSSSPDTLFLATGINTSSVFEIGKAGDVTIITPNLTVTEGAQITTSSGSDAGTIIIPLGGEGGNIEVEAQTLIINGTSSSGRFNSLLSSESFTNADAGNIKVTADTLNINNGSISVSTAGEGNAGSITLNTGNLQLKNKAQINAITTESGNAGTVDITANNISLNNNSTISSSTSGTGDAGSIQTRANQNISLDKSTIESEVDEGATGDAGTVNVNANNISLNNNSSISSSTSGTGDAGSIQTTANQTISLDNSTIESEVNEGAIGDAGTVDVTGNNISLNNNSTISSSTSGTGDAGSIQTTANQTISLDNSTIESEVDEGAIGDAGTVEVIAPNIDLNNNSIITSSTAGDGDAGDVIIDAANQLTLNNNSFINSAALPTAGSDAGNVDIVTGNLDIFNSSGLSTSNEVEGSGGNINIRTFGNLTLKNQAFISSETQGGAGNIIINADNVFLNNNSQISTNATGEAAGGNIIINTGFLLGLGNSDITANSQNSAGGQIIINAGGVLGLQVRENLTENSDITATGTLSGSITLNIDETEEGRSQIQLPQNIIDPSILLSQNVCQQGSNSEFIIFGKGGLAISPSDFLTPNLIEIEWVEPVINQEIDSRELILPQKIGTELRPWQPLKFASCR